MRVFVSAAGQGVHQDYQWRAEDGDLDERLMVATNRYLDSRELSWVLLGRESEFLLLVHALPSRKTDLQGRAKRNGFAILVPQQEERLLRSVMVQLLKDPSYIAHRLDVLVNDSTGEPTFGWDIDFKELRDFLSGLNLPELDDSEPPENAGSYDYSITRDCERLAGYLVHHHLPAGREFIALVNPICSPSLKAVPFWVLVTRGGERKAADSIPVSAGEIVFAIGFVALVGLLWLAIASPQRK